MFGLAHEYDPAVVRRVEPLVRVGSPGIGVGEARGQTGKPRACRRPQSESPVNVYPRARVAGRRANLSRGIECPCVYIACLNAYDGRAGKVGQRVRAHTPLSV